MPETEQVPAIAIAKLNDELRQLIPNLPFPHQLVLTDEVAALPADQLSELLSLVKNFNVFTDENDPFKEHDFGKIEMRENTFFWKYDYFDPALKYFEQNGQRVLTVMFSHEY